MAQAGTARPGGVTTVAILGIVGGVLLLLTSIGLFAASSGGLAVITLVFGVIDIIVSIFLLQGSNIARIVLSFSLGVSVLTAFVGLFEGGSVASAIGAVVLPLIGLFLLWTASANKYFLRS